MAKMSKREILLSRRLAVKGPMAPPDDVFRTDYPLLFDLLTRPLIVGGRVLEAARLILQIGDGDWHLSISDGVLCQSLSCREDTLLTGLAHMNHLVGAEEAKWTVWRGKDPKVPKQIPNGQKKKVAKEVDAT